MHANCFARHSGMVDGHQYLGSGNSFLDQTIDLRKTRSYDTERDDTEKIGWKVELLDQGKSGAHNPERRRLSYDTLQHGTSNRGHRFGTDLRSEQKLALLESLLAELSRRVVELLLSRMLVSIAVIIRGPAFRGRSILVLEIAHIGSKGRRADPLPKGKCSRLLNELQFIARTYAESLPDFLGNGKLSLAGESCSHVKHRASFPSSKN